MFQLSYNILMIPVVEDILNQLGLILGSLQLCLINLNTMQTLVWFLLFHLCYYSISFRIKILSSLIETAAKGKVSGKCKCIKALRSCAYLFDQLCAASVEINSTFSLSVLFILVIVMIQCSLCLFFFIYAMSELVVHSYIKGATYAFPIIFLMCMGLTLFILITANGPIAQVFSHIEIRVEMCKLINACFYSTDRWNDYVRQWCNYQPETIWKLKNLLRYLYIFNRIELGIIVFKEASF